jgi:hypothetical protein
MDYLYTYYLFPRNPGLYTTLFFPSRWNTLPPPLIKTSRTFSRPQLRKLVVANDGYRELIDETHIYIARLDKASLDLISIKLEILAYNNTVSPPSRKKVLGRRRF